MLCQLQWYFTTFLHNEITFSHDIVWLQLILHFLCNILMISMTPPLHHFININYVNYNNAIQCTFTQFSAIWCNFMQFSVLLMISHLSLILIIKITSIVLYQFCIVLPITMQFSAIWYDLMQFSAFHTHFCNSVDFSGFQWDSITKYKFNGF